MGIWELVLRKIDHLELPLAPHAIEAQKLADLRASKPTPNWGYLIDLKDVPGAISIADAAEKLPETIEYRGSVFHKDVPIYDAGWHIQYRHKDCPYPEGCVFADRKISYVKLLAQQWFGMTYCGIDPFMYKFSEFIGIWLDSNNIHEHFNSFSSYVAKECNVEPNTIRTIIRFIFKLQIR